MSATAGPAPADAARAAAAAGAAGAASAPAAAAAAAGSPSRVVRFVVLTDFPAGSAVQVVGSASELGAWKPGRGVTLAFDVATHAFVGDVRFEVPASGAPLDLEYKVAVAPPPASTTATAGDGSGGGSAPTGVDPDWQWQPGANRKLTLAATAGGEPSPVVVAQEKWFPRRDGTGVLASDPYLEPHKGHLQHRYRLFTEALATIEAHGGGLDAFSRGWERYGFNRGTGPAGGTATPAAAAGAAGAKEVPGVWYREWAPAATAASVIGDFNGWDHSRNPCVKDDFGVFTTFIPDGADGTPAIAHNTFVKVSLVLPTGERVTRVPAWIRYAVYDPKLNEYVGKYWCPPEEDKHVWKHSRPRTFAVEDYATVPGIDALKPLGSAAASGSGAAAAPAGAAAAVVGAATGGDGTAGRSKADDGAHMVTVKTTIAPSAYGIDADGSDAAVTATCLTDGIIAATPVSAGGVSTLSIPVDPTRDPAATGVRIYEAHVGMGSEDPKVGSYREFADAVLPRIKALGYNVVQLMAIMEHAYYGSFGYHVTSFLAPSSRFGTPEDLKYLVDTAHGLGLVVIMDLVHSHAAKNVNDGINRFDGTDHHYFHSGEKGNHALWDSRLFDYSKLETQRFLLSSARLFIEEFRFDGYRFDGVTSMMYHHHGLSYGFSGGYHEYFGESTDMSAMVYLMLANHLLHSCQPPALSIAEDVSGMPTLCQPVWQGGVGFDYRLGMAIPDNWIKLLKEKKDEEWDLGNIIFTLTNRRWQEKTIAYAESHDQALVGDKTLAFWLMDKEMYWHMSTLEKPLHPVIDRGLSLHKMIRLITCALGGEGYLNFMGNEFGHPEWIDFPREGNGWSYQHCRRQWHLVDDSLLHYKHMNRFDAAMNKLQQKFPWLVSHDSFVSRKHEGDRVIVFDRYTAGGHLLFVFNLHPTKSYEHYRVGAPVDDTWTMVLDSDWEEFGGHARVDRRGSWGAEKSSWDSRPCQLHVYAPSRSVQVYARK